MRRARKKFFQKGKGKSTKEKISWKGERRFYVRSFKKFFECGEWGEFLKASEFVSVIARRSSDVAICVLKHYGSRNQIATP